VSGRTPDRPVRLATNRQDWLDLTFLHWPYDVATVQAHVPAGLEVQELDGAAWVGVTPFRMAEVRLPGLPSVPGWSSFPELNVRTYVRGPDGHDGIWFFALECDRRAVVLALRTLGLPYVRAVGRVGIEPDAGERASAGGTGSTYRYAFARRRTGVGALPDLAGGAAFRAVVQVGEPVEASARTAWLDGVTGRWNAWSVRGGRLLRTPVEHEVWPLWDATVDGDLERPLLSVGLPAPVGPPRVHWSRGVHSVVGVPHVVQRVDGG
jgi:uncharacterized protein YqjF (DUF2071 family)